MLKGHKILITGLTGNLGGTVAKALAADNELWGLARYTEPGQRAFWDKAGVRTVVGDYAANELSDVPDDFEYVIHMGVNNYAETSEIGMRDNAEGVGLLMHHCRKARAFLHVSTVGVYAQKSDPNDVYHEDDPLGGGSMAFYTGSKLAGEGAARTMCRVLNLPTVICRMAVQYGHFHLGGMPGVILRWLLSGESVPLRRNWSNRHALISNDDVVRFIEPTLNAATVPATVMNWGGDINVPAVEMVEHLAQLAGVEPRWHECDETQGFPSFPIDPARRISITGPCEVDWRDGLTRLYHALHAEIRASVAAAR